MNLLKINGDLRYKLMVGIFEVLIYLHITSFEACIIYHTQYHLTGCDLVTGNITFGFGLIFCFSVTPDIFCLVFSSRQIFIPFLDTYQLSNEHQLIACGLKLHENVTTLIIGN